jgi:hypothetical protein
MSKSFEHVVFDAVLYHLSQTLILTLCPPFSATHSEYVDTAVRHVMMRQGILGVKVSIMLPHDPKGIIGPKSLLSDVITILEPKDAN